MLRRSIKPMSKSIRGGGGFVVPDHHGRMQYKSKRIVA